MKKFKTQIASSDSINKFDFECYENDIPIDLGDKYIFFFGGIADVQVCDSEAVRTEINNNNRSYMVDRIDLVFNFWRNCYKIKSTNFDLSLVS